MPKQRMAGCVPLKGAPAETEPAPAPAQDTTTAAPASAAAAVPVAPTAPTVSPCARLWPTRTPMRLRCAYTVTCWLRCRTNTTLP